MTFELACVVGESSGDLLAAQALSSLKAQHPDLQLSGIAGPALNKLGFSAHYSIDDLSVFGVFEVLRHYPRLKRMQNHIIELYQTQAPRLFLGVDAPDFNLTIEQKLKNKGIKTVHFISPSIWAWRRGRIKKIQRAVDHMLLIFPFEEAIYRAAGIPATYVGHPLAQIIPEQPNTQSARTRLNLTGGGPFVTIMPGSRLSEIRHNTAAFISAAHILARQYPQMTFLIPFVGAAQKELFENVLQNAHLTQFNWLPLMGHSHDAIEAADAVLVASGTATLEVALYQKPMVIAYKMLSASYHLLKHFSYQPWVGLPNILAREALVPEFLQHQATPENLARALNQVLNQNPTSLVKRFQTMYQELKRPTAHLVAETLVKVSNV